MVCAGDCRATDAVTRYRQITGYSLRAKRSENLIIHPLAAVPAGKSFELKRLNITNLALGSAYVNGKVARQEAGLASDGVTRDCEREQIIQINLASRSDRHKLSGNQPWGNHDENRGGDCSALPFAVFRCGSSR